MFKIARPLFIYTETSVHAGSGSEVGVVDLPIQRERHTDYPKIESSGVKGCLREHFEDIAKDDSEITVGDLSLSEKNIKNLAVELMFGPEEVNQNAYAAALGLSDARILLFPVKAMKGVFAWITCPHVLERFKKDMELCGMNDLPEIPKTRTVPDNSNLLIENNKFGSQVVLEEYSFTVNSNKEEKQKCTKLSSWLAENVLPQEKYWKDKLRSDLVVLNNEDFRDFVLHSTEVITRTKINSETGTVQGNALFNEEYLPTDSMLYSLVLSTPILGQNNAARDLFNQDNHKEHSCNEISND